MSSISNSAASPRLLENNLMHHTPWQEGEKACED